MSTALAAVSELPKLLPWRRILLIEPDRASQIVLRRLFQIEGYEVQVVLRIAQAMKQLRDAPPSAVVLGFSTPDFISQQAFSDMRSADNYVPIIVLGTSSAMERVLFLELGADDYVVKPFNERELLARVRAAVRRSERNYKEAFSFSDVQIDFRKMEVRREGNPIILTAQEFKVLKFMTLNAERAISREELLNLVWGYQNYPTTRTVDNHILKLRQKLEPEPSNPIYFQTVHCIGYKFVPRPTVNYSVS